MNIVEIYTLSLTNLLREKNNRKNSRFVLYIKNLNL